MRIVRQYGTMWVRNAENIAKIPSSKKGGRGRIRHVYMANGLPQTLMGPPILFP